MIKLYALNLLKRILVRGNSVFCLLSEINSYYAIQNSLSLPVFFHRKERRPTERGCEQLAAPGIFIEREKHKVAKKNGLPNVELHVLCLSPVL
jgi:hypothetical protein